MVAKLWQQQHEVAGHIISLIRKKRVGLGYNFKTQAQ